MTVADAPAARGRIERLHEALHRHRYILAPLSFSFGVGSFLLIQRRESLAQWLAVLLLATWLFSILELALPRRMRVPPGVLRFITQQTHQEAFFFALPFLLRTTSWHTSQAVFTVGVAIAAVCSMWDPLYFDFIARRRWLYLAFHALAVFLVMLIALPILLQLTTSQTIMLASGAIALLAVPSLTEPVDAQGRPHGLWLFVGALALAAAFWIGRGIIPPATLWLSDETITTTIDTEHRVPGVDMRQIPSELAVERGVYAFTAIRAPRGLREKVFHQWYENGKLVVSVPLEITGGREEGYRAWTHKTGFSGAPERGYVRVITESGQLLGDMRFAIGGHAQPQDPQLQNPQPEPKAPAASERAGAAEESQFESADPIVHPDQQQATPAEELEPAERSGPVDAAPESEPAAGDDDDGPTPAPGETIQAPAKPAPSSPDPASPALSEPGSSTP